VDGTCLNLMGCFAISWERWIKSDCPFVLTYSIMYGGSGRWAIKKANTKGCWRALHCRWVSHEGTSANYLWVGSLFRSKLVKYGGHSSDVGESHDDELWITSLPKSMSICEHPYGVLDKELLLCLILQGYRVIAYCTRFYGSPNIALTTAHLYI